MDATLRPHRSGPHRPRPTVAPREALLWALTATLVAAAVALWVWLAALAG